ncbi:unnamed protein product [Blepharisma stoltei]|uniref:Multidrug and toxic compound extrusion protein n=1 Tax=Blepharisma stoltei TaxID=1481888 RepID=A0AAU9IGC8_9CILI|nr:unnamed protein product [Blepharisma stoltei]
MEENLNEYHPIQKKPIFKRVKRTFKLASMFSYSILITQIQELIVMWFIGNYLGAKELEAFGISSIWVELTATSVFIGISGAIDTLCSQAHGVENIRLQTLILHKSLFMGFLCCIPSAITWGFSTQIFDIFGLECSEEAGEYLRYFIYAMPAKCIYEIVSHFMFTQYVLIPEFICSSTDTPLQILLNYLLVPAYGMKGAAIAGGICAWVRLGIFFISLFIMKCHKNNWSGFDFSNFFDNWGELVKLSVSSTAHIFVEWTAFEISALFAAWINDGDVSLAAWVILLKVLLIEETISTGFGEAAATLIGNSVTKLKISLSKQYMKISIILSALVNGMILLALFISRYEFGKLFFMMDEDDSSEDIVRKIGDIFPLYAIIYASDSIYLVIVGAMRALGKQPLNLVIAIGADLIVGVPSQYIFGILIGLELGGIILGIMICYIIEIAPLFYIFAKLDWNKESQIARLRSLEENNEKGIELLD